MNNLLIIFLLLIVVYVMDSYNQKREKIRLIKEKLNSLQKVKGNVISKLTEEEISVLKEMYGKDFYNSSLVQLNGIYKEKKINFYNKYIKFFKKNISYIGEFQIVIPSNFRPELEEEYMIKGALYNGKIFLIEICREVIIEDNFFIEQYSIIKELENIHNLKKNRKLKISEKKLMVGRIIPGSIGSVFFLLAWILKKPIIQFYIAIITFLFMIMVNLKQIMKKRYVYQIEGKLLKLSKDRAIVGGIQFYISEKWLNTAKNGQEVYIEGEKKSFILPKLLAVKFNEHSIEKEKKQFNLKRFLFRFFILVIYGLFAWNTWNTPLFKKYREISEKTIVFNNYNEIRNHNFKKGEKLYFNKLKYFESVSNNKKIYLLKNFLAKDKKLDKRIVEFQNKINELENFKKNPDKFIQSNKNLEYKNIKEYQVFLNIKNNKNSYQFDIDEKLKKFIDVYIEKINKEINKIRSEQERKINKEIIFNSDIAPINLLSYYLEIDGSISKAKLSNAFYGSSTDWIEAKVKNIKKEDNILELSLELNREYVKIKEEKDYEYLMWIYEFIISILFLLLFIEIFRTKK